MSGDNVIDPPISFETKDILDILNEFEKLSSKTVEIISLIIGFFIFAISFIDLIIIKWKNISKNCLVLFIFMFIISIIILVLSIIIRYWRAKNLIKTDNKRKGHKISICCIILSIIFSLLSYIEFNVFKQNLLLRYLDIVLATISYYLFQVFSCLQIGFWLILRKRIKEGLDGPEKEIIFEIQKIATFNFHPPSDDSISNIIIYSNQNKIQKRDDNNSLININENINQNS